MKKAEYFREEGCLQRDRAEHEEYAGARSVDVQEVKEQDGAELLERILNRENLNRAYKRVRANKGAPGIDGMTVEEALPWLREHREELLESIRAGKYKPQPVRRKEIPKREGGKRQLGIPTVIDRMIQQAIAQQLTPIYKPLFSEDSYGYRPGRSAQQAIMKGKEYAEKGYTQAVLVDLSKYFDTLNHELLMNLVRKNVKDKRVIDLIKKYLKAGVMENGLLVRTREGSPQGGPLSPLLANIYIRGWLGYFGIASMKTTMQKWDEWLRRRLRVYIWKQWKVPKARIKNLIKLGIPRYYAYKWGYVKGYWNVAGSPVLTRSITNERLAQAGYYSILNRYESVHLCD